jgi:hypothetical protein
MTNLEESKEWTSAAIANRRDVDMWSAEISRLLSESLVEERN